MVRLISAVPIRMWQLYSFVRLTKLFGILLSTPYVALAAQGILMIILHFLFEKVFVQGNLGVYQMPRGSPPLLMLQSSAVIFLGIAAACRAFQSAQPLAKRASAL